MLVLMVVFASAAQASLNLQFDICPFQTTVDGSASHFVANNFAHLNTVTANGHYLALGTDTHRPEITAAGNGLAIYYNSFNNLYSGSSPDPAGAAAALESYSKANYTNTGSEPSWIILNEISGSLWPSNATYRSWVTATVAILHNTYHHNVIMYAPFTSPGANASDWDSLASNSYIAVEDYLSGSAMKAQNFSVAWATQKYQSPKAYYQALGVPVDRLMLGEHFSQTLAGTGFGRDGVSSADWDRAITARNQAALASDYVGFLSYAWDKNAMLTSEAEQIQHEDTYMASPVLASEVPEPGVGGVFIAIALLARRRSPIK
jgi:hypothetical protein